MTTYGVATDYDRNAGRKRDYVRVWSGPFFSVWEADGVSLPKGDGYMLTTYNGDRVRVSCPTPRTDETFERIDAAISAALHRHYGECDIRQISADGEDDGLTWFYCDTHDQETLSELYCEDGTN